MLEFLLIRHGQTDWNVRQMVMGRQPIPLNERGREQARGLGEYLAKAGLSRIITSPIRRALETAHIIAAQAGGVAVEEEGGLSEIDYGEWVNLSFAELLTKHGETWRRYREDPNDLLLPGGESMAEVVARVGDVIDRVRAEQGDGRVAFISHADIIKIALLNLLGLELKTILKLSIDNCSMLLVRFSPELGPRLVLYNAANGFGKDM